LHGEERVVDLVMDRATIFAVMGSCKAKFEQFEGPGVWAEIATQLADFVVEHGEDWSLNELTMICSIGGMLLHREDRETEALAMSTAAIVQARDGGEVRHG